MREIEINVTKTIIEPVKIKLPMFFYAEDQDEDKEFGIYAKIDEDLTATLFVREYEINWTDEKPRESGFKFKIEVIRNYYPNEIELANQITKKRFNLGVREFWDELLKNKLVKIKEKL